MMSLKSKYLALAAMAVLLPGSSENLFDNRVSRYYIPDRHSTNLPTWKVGEPIIHAKDAKTAEKYAKKRGLWKEGYKVEKKENNDENN